jgi:hypothetical protein
VPLGPKAKEVVKRYLVPNIEAFLFAPSMASQERAERMRQERRTPCWPSHLAAKAKQKAKSPRRKPGERYKVGSYTTAIKRACSFAFPPPEHLGPKVLDSGKPETKRAWLERLTAEGKKAELAAWTKAHNWHSNRLRHQRAKEVKREAGLDAARAVLGQKTVQVTEHYATLDIAKGAEVMAKMG